MMGKPNVAKMANFMEIDVFVLVACPENSLIDSQVWPDQVIMSSFCQPFLHVKYQPKNQLSIDFDMTGGLLYSFLL